jgi:hypothetical protein
LLRDVSPVFFVHVLCSQVGGGELNFSFFAEKGSCHFLHAPLVPMLLGQVGVDIWEALLELCYL